MSNTESLDQYKRIDDLEVKFTLQDELIFELNQVVTEQQFEIKEMQKKITALLNKSETGSTEERDLKDEIPPHY